MNLIKSIKQKYQKKFHPEKKVYFTEPLSIIESKNTAIDYEFEHIAAFIKNGNGGDILLPRMVRDLVEFCCKKIISWEGTHAHTIVNDSIIEKLNNKQAIIIGGGGLFLRDTNKNDLSGWQWSCSVENMEKIKTPIALFAVGYNRFRGQKDFKPVFKKSLQLITEKSVYLGLRNQGSIKAIKSYLPEHLHHKVRFQPCPTTVAAQIYPEQIKEAKQNQSNKVIALNYAHDRIKLRLGKEKNRILKELAQCMLHFSKQGYTIKFFAHLDRDEKFLPYLDEINVPYTLVKLYNTTPLEILTIYSQVTLAVGMRGHAQMIPFGCGTPTISLISHDKLAWFLEDINRTEWGVEMKDPDFADLLKKLIHHTFENRDSITNDIYTIQKKLMDISQRNVDDLMNAVTLSN